MLKLKRLHLEELEDRFQVLSKEEQETLFGAGSIFVFDSYGNVIDRIENNLDYDEVRANGSTYVVSGTIQVSNYTLSNNQTGLQIEGGNYDLFKFLAKETNVEWGAVLSGGLYADGQTDCLMQTSHGHNNCQTSFDCGSFDTFIHSHPPKTTNTYSPTDAQAWHEIYNTEGNAIVNFGLYLPESNTIRNYSDDVIFNRLDLGE